MPEIYTAADIDHVEFSTDAGLVYTAFGLHDADTVELNENPVKSSVNKGQNATAKKQIVFTGNFHNMDASVLGALKTAEQNLTGVRFKVVLLNTANSFETLDAIINITRSTKKEEKFLGYTVEQQYEVDRKTGPYTSETIV